MNAERMTGNTETETQTELLLLHSCRLNLPPFLDIHVADHCNLGCAGCLHYAPVAPRRFLDPGEYREDLAALAKVPGLQRFFAAIVLMGGEPLLNPALPEISRITRHFFPETRIDIATNGLLLKKMPAGFWQACRDASVRLYLSAYPIGIDYDALEALGRENGVETVRQPDALGNDREKQVFWRHRLDPQGRCSALHSWTICRMDYTLQLRGGALYPCNRGAYMDVLNGAFGTEFIHQPGDFVNIADLKSAEDLDSFRRRPHPMCRYCDNDATRRVNWARSKRDPHEWIKCEDEDENEG